MKYYQQEKEIKELVGKFQNKELTESNWTHEAHLTVAVFFVKNYDYYEAICYLRSGIIEYNTSIGGKNTPMGGYHETITLFWVWLIHQYVKINPQLTILDLCNDFLNSKYSNKNLLNLFYTKDRLFSTYARAVWVEPNLQSMKFPF